jgi:hypothetical protein
MGVSGIKRGLLTFWAAWTGLVFASNAADGLKSLRVPPQSWAFASRNYSLMIKVTAIYHPPKWIVVALFSGVLMWQAAGTWSYGRAAINPCSESGRRAMLSAFGINLALWAAFMIADEVFLAYPMENVHRALFMAQLVTLIAIWLLGSDELSHKTDVR